MAQASQQSLIKPLGRFIFSSVFSFSLLALCVGGVSEAIRGWEENRKKKNFTPPQKHKQLFLTKSNGFSLESLSFSLISDEDTPI